MLRALVMQHQCELVTGVLDYPWIQLALNRPCVVLGAPAIVVKDAVAIGSACKPVNMSTVNHLLTGVLCRFLWSEYWGSNIISATAVDWTGGAVHIHKLVSNLFGFFT